MIPNNLATALNQRDNIDEQSFDLIVRAYKFASSAHQDQFRYSGDQYITHPIEVAIILTNWGLDALTISAGLLHDVIEDTSCTLPELEKEFGPEIGFIVDSVTKISKRLRYSGNESQVETLKKMILAIGKDVRVIFIKLADRLHNMRTLDAVPLTKQRRIALETNDIYAPLAYRIGMANIASDLEDLSFPFLHPNESRWLTKVMKEHFEQGEEYVQKVHHQMSELLNSKAVSFISIDARSKRISSLYKKLKRVGMDVNQVHDLTALRIIVPTIADCYASLGIIHEAWPPLPGKIKDYIALPKPNGYRSLHTTVFCIDQKPTEFQIRTKEMHQENEFGLAAYWAYHKSKTTKNYQEGNKVSFAKQSELDILNQLKNWQDNFSDGQLTLQSLKEELFMNRIFVITPTGEVIDLPEGSTPIDFAYMIHSDIGDNCIGARVNNKLVSLDQELVDGDVVEIITQKNKRPNKSWLQFAKTSKAKSRIRSALREEEDPTISTRARYKIIVIDQVGIISQITSIFSKNKINIVAVHSQSIKGTRFVHIKIIADIFTKDTAEKILYKIRENKNTHEVHYQF